MLVASSNIVVPLASFYEKSGTYINCDGIRQKLVSKMNKDNPAHTVTSVIEEIQSLIKKGTI